MVARGLDKSLDVEQREYIFNSFVAVCGEDIDQSVVEALGLVCHLNFDIHNNDFLGILFDFSFLVDISKNVLAEVKYFIKMFIDIPLFYFHLFSTKNEYSYASSFKSRIAHTFVLVVDPLDKLSSLFVLDLPSSVT